MAYIKKLVMHGFKSFVRKTELPFTPGINVILGPNGSGKSNVSDALCFVLGRLGVKSMRATKASNLIFLGTKSVGPAKEAMVEIVFDNSDNTFTINKEEVSIKRIVRKNGQSIYKINNETKTRQDILTLLAQAGIDPNGFNIILQGEIQDFVKMHKEERRKIVEEVSGISIYESKKEKSLKELDKTDDKLKEATTTLKERTAYLNNLERERQQALRYKKIEQNIKNYKASIINHDLNQKEKDKQKINQEVEIKNKEIAKIRKNIISIETTNQTLESDIKEISEKVQKATGLEQEKLNQEIANLRVDIAGLNFKTENYENKIQSLVKQKSEKENALRDLEVTIKEIQKETPTIVKKGKEIEKKKKELEELEKQKKQYYTIKTELKSVRDRISDKRYLLQNYNTESEFHLKQIKNLSLELFDEKTSKEKLEGLKIALTEKRQHLDNINKREIELEKTTSASEFEIDDQNKVIEKISKMDICPLCKSKITPEHIKDIHSEINPRLKALEAKIHNSDKELNDIYTKREVLKRDIEQISTELSKRESDLIKISNINEKQQQIKIIQENIENTQKELQELEKKRKNLERNFDDNSNIEQKYETAQIEMRDISLRSEENISSEVSFKQRELEREQIALKQVKRDLGELKEELDDIKLKLKERTTLFEKKQKQEEEISKKYKQLIEKKEKMQKTQRENEYSVIEKQREIHHIEENINNFKVNMAKINAEIESLEMDILNYPNAEIIKARKEVLSEKLAKNQDIFDRIGTPNLRALEVYDSVKEEYDSIKDKVDIIEREKQGIMKIIHEIDIKKKKTFLKTLTELNDIFSNNFSQLSAKGQVTLELENKKDPFEGGIGIIVKTGYGKYFDVTSLSGGEQTLVALSLIFAIQELNPYCFYVLDEIDAALDKKNSERLGGLLQKYMQQGQYIVITHNDEIIRNATNIYGVSMHDGVSKTVSWKL